MARWPAVAVLLPQVWVVQAFRSFHEAAMATPVTVFESARLAVVVDSVAVIAVGWLTVAANLLIAATLVWLVVAADDRARRQRASGSLRTGTGASTNGQRSTVQRPAVVARLRATPRLIATTPFERVAPRRAEADGKPA